MITEHNEGTVEPLRLTETAQQIAEEFPELARRRAIHFFRLYPRLVRWGFLALAVLPFVFLLLLFITRMKLAMLLGWIISARTVCELSGRGSDECGRVPQRDPAREPAVPAGHALQADACRTYEAV